MASDTTREVREEGGGRFGGFKKGRGEGRGSDAGKDAGARKRFPGQDRMKIPAGFIFDYKNALLLRNYISEVGKLMPARLTRLTSKQQRQLKSAIKRARHLALIPYTDKYKKF